MEDGEESMSDCSVDSNELPPMPPLTRIKRNLFLSGNSSKYGTPSAQTTSESPITGIRQSMQNAAAEALIELDPEDTLPFHKDDSSGAPTVPPLTGSTKKESSTASYLAHYGCGVSSTSRRGQVWHDKRKDARPEKSLELRYGDESPSKCSSNTDPEQPGQPVLKSTANTSFSSYPFHQSRISETRKKETSEESDAIDIQRVRGNVIRHQPIGSQCTAMVLDQVKRSMSKTLYKCRECSRQFKKANDLRRHERVHTGERPFKCDVCSKRFSLSGNLLVHKRVHTGERPFKCDVCSKRFSLSGNLLVHKRVHTGEKPFACKVCEASFAKSSNLREHERIHAAERPYKCETCEASFKLLSCLRRHERIHTRVRSHQCKVCGASFRRLSTLRAHERGTHWIVPRGAKHVDRISTEQDIGNKQNVNVLEKAIVWNI